jgi:Tfp pilus assembly protein PilF
MHMHQPEADLLVQAAAADLANGRFTPAVSLLEQALRADPRHKMALTMQAEMALYGKDPRRALALTGTVLAIEPNFAPALHQRAAAFWSLGQQTEALQAARQAVDIQPPNPDFRLRLARFAAWTGHGADTRAALVPRAASTKQSPISIGPWHCVRTWMSPGCSAA